MLANHQNEFERGFEGRAIPPLKPRLAGIILSQQVMTGQQAPLSAVSMSP